MAIVVRLNDYLAFVRDRQSLNVVLIFKSLITWRIGCLDSSTLLIYTFVDALLLGGYDFLISTLIDQSLDSDRLRRRLHLCFICGGHYGRALPALLSDQSGRDIGASRRSCSQIPSRSRHQMLLLLVDLRILLKRAVSHPALDSRWLLKTANIAQRRAPPTMPPPTFIK